MRVAGAPLLADVELVETLTIECLACGEARTVPAAGALRHDPGECPRCGYIGWAPSASLTERTRRRIRERPLERRAKLYAV
ncbi:MAG TPA: hypothetical protein VHF67_00225 [Gaiellaceae bacterium]|nr:hypothetical protein [Gaiellaceae bacterium]